MSSSIITILIVLFILFIFRRLDKNSVKLNKVKQYVERVVNRLEGYEKSWTEKVTVQEAALNELINRSETLNKSLMAKIDILTEKEQKIRDAEGVIHETESNVSALLNEVDNVNKGMEQVRKTALQVQEIEKHAEQLQKHLESTLLHFKDQEQQVNDSFLVKIESLKTQVQLTEKKLSEKVSAENITLMTIIKRMKETFSFSEKENLQRLQKVSQEITARTDEALKESLAKVHQLNETVKSIEVTHMTNKNLMLESFRENASQLEKRIEETRALFTEAMAEAQKENLDKVKELHQVMQKMTEDFGTDAEKHVDEIRALADDSKSAVQKVKSEMELMKKQTLSDFQNGISTMQKELKEKEATVLKSTEEKINSFTLKLNELLLKYKEDKKSVEKTVNEKLDEFNTKMKSAMALVDSAEKSVEKGVDQAVKAAAARLSESEKKTQEMARASHDMAQKKLEERVLLFTTNINSLLDKYKEDRKVVEGLVKERLTEFDDRSKSVLSLLNNTEKQIKDAIDAAVKQAADLKLGNLDDVLQKNIAILNETAVTAESRMKDDYEKIAQGMGKKIKNVQTEVNGMVSKFTAMEAQLMEKTQGRIENLDKEYREKLQNVEKQFADFEEKVSQEIAADITTFKRSMDNVLETSRKTENDMLKEAREKLAQFHNALKQFDERLGISESDFLQKMQEKYQAVEDKLTQKMDLYETKITERDKKASERAKTELEKMNLNIEKMKELFKKHETNAKAQYASLLTSLETTSSKLRERTEKSTQEFINGTTERLKRHETEIEGRLRTADEALDKVIGEARKRMQERVAKLHDEIKTMRETAKGDLTGFLTDSETRLAGLEEKSNDLARKADDLEKNFESALKSYVGTFNNQVANKIKEFTSNLKITEKATSDQVREFLDALKADYEGMKTALQTQSSKMMTEEMEKIEQLQSRITEVQKTVDYFLTQTKLFENANKMKLQLTDDIRKFGEYMKTIKGEKKNFENFEAQVEKLDKRGAALQDEITKIMAERKKVEQVDEKIKDMYGMIKELDLKLASFKKEKDRINDLSDRFKDLDEMVKKVNADTSVFSEKEADINRTMDILNNISTTYNQLDKAVEGFSGRITRFEDKSNKLEEKIDSIARRQLELGSAEEQFKKLADRVEDIKPNLDFIDKQADRLDQLRKWANKTQDELEEYLADADEKIKSLQTILNEIPHMTQETRQVREKLVNEAKEKASAKSAFPSSSSLDSQSDLRVIKLYRQGMSAEDIARMCKLPLAEVKSIIKENG